MKKIIFFLLIFSLLLPVYSFAFFGSYTVGSGTWSPSNPQTGLQYVGCDERKTLWWDGRRWYMQRIY